MYKNFLSDDECDNIISLAKVRKAFEESHNFSSVYLDYYPNLPANLKAIERRIGVVTGLPPHPNEEPINVHRIKAGEDVGIEVNAETFLNVGNSVNATDCISKRRVTGDSASCPLWISSVHHDFGGNAKCPSQECCQYFPIHLRPQKSTKRMRIRYPLL